MFAQGQDLDLRLAASDFDRCQGILLPEDIVVTGQCLEGLAHIQGAGRVVVVPIFADPYEFGDVDILVLQEVESLAPIIFYTAQSHFTPLGPRSLSGSLLLHRHDGTYGGAVCVHAKV